MSAVELTRHYQRSPFKKRHMWTSWRRQARAWARAASLLGKVTEIGHLPDPKVCQVRRGDTHKSEACFDAICNIHTKYHFIQCEVNR